MSARRSPRNLWDGSTEPTGDETDKLIGTPEPDPWTHLEPLFPVTSFTPESKCPHNGPIAEGSSFVCMVCYASGKDGYKALPRNIKPLPDDLEPQPEADTEADKPKPTPAAATSNKLRGGLG